MPTSLLNWQRKRSWNDIQNAKFFDLVDGKGILLTNKNHLSIIRCKKAKFDARLDRLTSVGFVYPLQSWKGDYGIFTRSSIAIHKKESFMKEVEKLCAKPTTIELSTDDVEVNVVTKYLAIDRQKSRIPIALTRSLTTSKIWKLIYNAAHTFVKENRPYELGLFEKMFKSYPRDCFINLYDTGLTCGIAKHSDHVSFCTVVLCLKGNGEGNLILIQENGNPLTVSLLTDELIVFGRIEHSVQMTIRNEKRITLNAFF